MGEAVRPGRLAIFDRGIGARRLLRALRELSHAGQRWTPIALATLREQKARWVRECAETVELVGPLPDALPDALRAARAEAVWLPPAPAAELARLAALCEAASVAVLGASAAVLQRVAAQAPGRGVHAHSVIEVVVARDARGASVAFEPSSVALHGGEHAYVVEAPAPGLSPRMAAAARDLALRAWEGVGLLGVGAARLVASPQRDQPSLLSLELHPACAPALEARYGLDLLRLHIELCTGASLPQIPEARGDALAAHVRSVDGPAHVLDVLRMPSGPGVRCEAAANEGDEHPGGEPLLTVVAQGGSRAEAAARLQLALIEADVLLRGGGTDKARLLGELAPGAVRERREVALVAAAIEACDAELDLERARFLAEARRGLPKVGPSSGRTIELRLDGHRHVMHVRQVGPVDYRVAPAGGVAAPVRVERVGRCERLLTIFQQRFRALVGREGLHHQVEVDGVPHSIHRDPSGVVVSPSPAVVVALEVAPGQQITAGAPLLRLESMKMELLVTSPAAGVVREVLVAANAQVEAGAPLLRLEALDSPRAAPPPAPLQLPWIEPRPLTPAESWQACCDELRRLLLGFDVPAADARRLAKTVRELRGVARDQDAALAHEAWSLGAFVDVQALFSRAQGADLDAEPRPPLEELWRYLHEPAARGAGLAPAFVEKLRRALSRYGASIDEPGRDLELALLRLWKAQERTEEQLPVLLAILEGRLESRELPPAAAAQWRELLDRLIELGQARFPALVDLSREVRYRLFDQPALDRARAEDYARAEKDLATLGGTGDGELEQLAARLVDFRFPLSTRLIGAMAEAPPHAPLLVETLLRRYYRSRQLTPARAFFAGPVPCAASEYPREGYRVRLLACFARAPQIEEALRALARAVADVPPSLELALELFAWDERASEDAEALSARLGAGLEAAGFTRPVRRAAFTLAAPGRGLGPTSQQHFCFRGAPGGFAEDRRFRGVHPMLFKRLQLQRLSEFDLTRLPAGDDVYLYRAVARANPKDERLFAVAEIRDVAEVRDERGRLYLPHLERMLLEAFAGMRLVQARRPAAQRLEWNRVLLTVIPPLRVTRAEVQQVVERLAPDAEGLGLEMVLLDARVPDPETGELREKLVRVLSVERGDVRLRYDEPTDRPLQPLADLQQRIVSLRRRGLHHPVEIARQLAPPADVAGAPHGTFVEHDLDERGVLVPVSRAPGMNTANLVVGVVRTMTPRYPEGMARVVLLGDGSREMGSLAAPECRRICAALDLAERMRVPLDWFALSAGAKISMQSGTENMDEVARALRRIVQFTQGGGEINVVVCGINVGAQPYWNAEATMLMHTRGVLIMVPASAMVLTGKQALEYSGSVSAADNEGIGGYERIMGPNGQAQYRATSLPDAIRILMEHHDHCYVAPGERFPRRARTADPRDRDVRPFPHGEPGGRGFATVGEVFSAERNPERNQPFDIRRVMAAAIDQDHPPLERWRDLRGGETAVVWDGHLGGQPVCLIGIESRPVPRTEFVPSDGPGVWTAGTLFPNSSKKIARAVNAASGNRPLVVLANLSGFDGSPESMRRLQLEYGAEIGRAVVNFDGPIVFCVVSRYHGGAFVVFSKLLREQIEVAALQGARASVIGGAPAAAVVFSREVETRTRKDGRVVAAEQQAQAGALPRAQLAEIVAAVRSEKLGEVGQEFDSIHTVERALRMGSVDRIIAARELRPYLIDAVERGMVRTLQRAQSGSGGSGG